MIGLVKRRIVNCLHQKVDNETAYNLVSWNFLDHLINRKGFGIKWRKWMAVCILSGSLSIIVNGSPTAEFQMHQGLQQGDLLALFLFIIAAEGLASFIRNVVNDNLLREVKVRNYISFPILQFVEDTILMYECCKDNLWLLKSTIWGFKLVLGLKVKFSKSNIIEINVSGNFINAAYSFLSCSIRSLPFKFLDILVRENPRRTSLWKPILLESTKRRLSSWRGKHISMGGRVTLINSVLGSILLYFFFLSFYKLSKFVCKEITKIHRQFMCGDCEKKKLCWVGWLKVFLPKVFLSCHM